jgi:hypothetical protein
MFARFDAGNHQRNLGVRRRDIYSQGYSQHGAAFMIWFTLYLELCRRSAVNMSKSRRVCLAKRTLPRRHLTSLKEPKAGQELIRPQAHRRIKRGLWPTSDESRTTQPRCSTQARRISVHPCDAVARDEAATRSLFFPELDAFPDQHRQRHRQWKPSQKNDQHHGSHDLTMSVRAAKFRDGTNTSIRNISREPDSCARSAAIRDEAAAPQVSKGGRPGEVDRKPEEGGDHCEHDADGKPLHWPPPADTPPQAVPVLSVGVIWRFVGHHLRPRSRHSRDGWNAQQLDINDKYQAENDRNRHRSRRCDQA